MLRARGPRLPFTYFFQTHLFDLLNGTDTHVWQPKDHVKDRPKHFENGVLYMASWSAVIRAATSHALKHLDLPAQDVRFIDIGCGKGKVLCIWHKMFADDALMTGIDYSQPLLDICAANLSKLGASDAQLLLCDATDVTFATEKPVTVAYLYNPFDAEILDRVVHNMAQQKTVVIYTNPVHLDVFKAHGFSLQHHHKGWHPNATYAVLSNLPANLDTATRPQKTHR
ncbi:MAG: methyltransferase domain-containing protein [Shimia sp.]|uniref:methyltransferase domain-containing protein n=1 Tax=Shimia sp. TaxID=1954381 RepID=UPI004058692F